MKELWRKIVRFRKRAEFERDLDEEMRHHLALKAEQQGDRAQANRQFGNITLLKEDIRDMWTFTFWERFATDIRYGIRAMNANRLFAGMAVLSLALGIGANTAIYSFVDAVMLRALPVAHPDQLAIANWRSKPDPPVIHSHNGSSYDEPGGGMTSPDFPWPAYENLRDNTKLFSSLFAHKSAGRQTILLQGQAEMGEVEMVSGNYFSGLSVGAAAGRLISDEDNRAGASQVAVLSYAFWRERFAGDRRAIGQTIRINNLPFTIMGVAAPEFFGVKPSAGPVMFVPIINRPSLARNYGDEQKTMFIDPHFYWVEIMGRLQPGVSLSNAQAELATRFRQFAVSSAADGKERANLPALRLEEGGSGIDSLRRQFSKPLFVLMAMVVLILAIACANIANLLLARAAARQREMAVRLSLGASRRRVLRQLLTESLLLAVPGGLLGLGVAGLAMRFLTWLIADGREDFFLRVQLNWHVLAFTLAVALSTGILFGIAPAIQATRVNVAPALKETRAGSPRARFHGLSLSRILMVSQIAVSLVLAAGAALFVRTLGNLHAVPLGFNEENLLVFNLDASQAGYEGLALKALYSRLDERFKSLPGVRAATVTGMPLVAGWNDSTSVKLPGRTPPPGGRFNTSYTEVGPAFFDTMQMPVLLGRKLDARDSAGAPVTTVVNEVFAKKYFPGENPIGKHFRLNQQGSPDVAIVGVAKTARYNSLKREVPPVIYLSYLQEHMKHPAGQMFFELRTAGDPLALGKTVRGVVHEEAASVPVRGMTTQIRRIDSTISQERIFANLCSAFALLALTIAAVGLYGTMAYAVSRRTNEIGIRMALGAARRRILGMVLREVLIVGAAGIVIGLAVVRATAPVVRSFLFGIKPEDPLSLSVAAVVLAAAALLAGYAPAWRASRVDPIAALRHE